MCYAVPKWKTDLYFWKRESKASLAEIDYLYDDQGLILPIEVKSGHRSTLRSLHQFLDEHPKSPKGLRFWAQNYSQMDKVDSRPLYAVATLAYPDLKEAIRSLAF